MKKSLCLTALMSLLSTSLFAQIGGIEDSVNDVSNTIRTIFPIILGVIFLIGFLFNAGHFFGENADLKKGIIRQIGDQIKSFIGSVNNSVVFINNSQKMEFIPLDSSEIECLTIGYFNDFNEGIGYRYAP